MEHAAPRRGWGNAEDGGSSLGPWHALGCVLSGGAIAVLEIWAIWIFLSVIGSLSGLAVEVSGDAAVSRHGLLWPVTSVWNGAVDVVAACLLALLVAGNVTRRARRGTRDRPAAWWPLTVVVLAFGAVSGAGAPTVIAVAMLAAIPLTLWVLCNLEPARCERLRLIPRSRPFLVLCGLFATAVLAGGLVHSYLNPLTVTNASVSVDRVHRGWSPRTWADFAPTGQRIIEGFAVANRNRPAVHLRSVRPLGAPPLGVRMLDVGDLCDNCTVPIGGYPPPVRGRSIGGGDEAAIQVTYTLTRCRSTAVRLPPLAVDYTVLGIARTTVIAARAAQALPCAGA